MKNNMTYRISGILTMCAFMILTGCNSFLDEVEPQGKEPSTAYMNLPDNAERAINACYDILYLTGAEGPDQNWVNNHYECYFGALNSDDAEKGSQPSDYPDLQKICAYQYTPSIEFVKSFYIHGFWGVSRTNYVLDNIKESPIDEKLKTRIEGEAHFLRAYNYFYLLRHFGGVPILTEAVKSENFGNIPRASLTETYDFIIDELTLATQMLPRKEEYLSKDEGRATKGSAQGLLARVMLYRLGTDPGVDGSSTTWQALYDLTGGIISEGSYSLVPNYATLFEELTDGNYSTESLFYYNGVGGWLSSSFKTVGEWMFTGLRGGSWFGWGFDQPTQDLVDAFDPTDPRLSSTVYGLGTANNGVIYGSNTEPYDRQGEMMSNYYNRKTAATLMLLLNGTTKGILVIRYADVLLMRAEAAYRIGNEGEARARVNEVRARARQSSYCKGYEVGSPVGFPMPTVAPNLPDITSSGEALLNDIWNERRLELAMENFRTYDLIRTGRLLDRVGTVKDDNRIGGSGKLNTTNNAQMEMRIPNIRENIKGNSLHVTVPGVGGGERYIPVLPLPETEINYWNLEGNPNN